MPKTIALIEPERILVELANQRYTELVAQANELLEQAEGVRATAYTSIVKRALREKVLDSAKGLKGPPEIVREEGLAIKLVWADGAEEPK